MHSASIKHRRLRVRAFSIRLLASAMFTAESESESESIRPESKSIRCESESIRPESESESESESIRPESESESSGSEFESESASPTEVRVSPDLSPDSAWTHESGKRKVLYFNPTFNHFAEPCIDKW